ncbi:Rne/Rng family ribonuclease [Wenjunlia vitaminophila]
MVEPEAMPAPKRTRRRAVAAAGAPTPDQAPSEPAGPTAEQAVAEPAPRRTRRRAAITTPPGEVAPADVAASEDAPVKPLQQEEQDRAQEQEQEQEPEQGATRPGRRRAVRPPTAVFQAPVFEAPVFAAPVFVVPEPEIEDEDVEVFEAPARPRRRRAEPEQPAEAVEAVEDELEVEEPVRDHVEDEADERPSRRRRRGGRRRRRGEAAEDFDEHVEEPEAEEEPAEAVEEPEEELSASGTSSSRRRRRRRRRSEGGVEGEVSADDPERTVVKVREPRKKTEDVDEVQSIKGSTRLEAKKQRRREGREQGRRRVPIITEAEFLARREAVERVMVVRQQGDRTQIGVLEDNVLVEHFVNKEQSTSYVGNVYLGKVQNVLPSMEAAFVDIGKGRNAVLYAGEVNFEALGAHGGPRRIESALKSGQPVLVQVTKDPIGHKGARLTSQVSLPGRYLVYVPEGSMTGISRKLPDTERSRLKQILKRIVPEDAGVIVRTAAEGASEEELSRDVARLQAQWEEIQKKAASGNAPSLLYGEPDMTVRVVRDIFNEDFSKVIVSGDEAWETIHDYVSHVAPDLADRLQRWTSEVDVFATYRIDEQLLKALDRKVWLPSGGSLVIDRTEAMVVIDVNTGKFTGQGGNLEETVTRNNLEAAEEIVRQLRLRDLGGIIVIDFIDMVLESNRDLVLRRLLECLGRDRTKHQVAEVTSLGLVQMTRKRVGQGLLESFSETCVHCNGRGLLVHMDQATMAGGGGKRRRRGKAASTAQPPVHELPEAAEGVVEPVEVEAEPVTPVEPVEVAGVELVDVTAEREPVVEEPVAPEPAPEAAEARPPRARRRASRKAMAPAGPPPSATAEQAVVVVPSTTPSVDEEARATEPGPGEPTPVEAAPLAATLTGEAEPSGVEPGEAPAVEEPVTPEPAAGEPVQQAPAKKRAARKAATRKTAAKATTARKTTAREAVAERVEVEGEVTAPAAEPAEKAEAGTETAAKKAPAKRAAAKKATAKRAPAKKAAAKKATVVEAAPVEPAVPAAGAGEAVPEGAEAGEAGLRQPAPRKAAARKTAAKKAPAKKAPAKKTAAKKTPAKKATTGRAAAKKPAAAAGAAHAGGGSATTAAAQQASASVVSAQVPLEDPAD